MDLEQRYLVLGEIVKNKPTFTRSTEKKTKLLFICK